MKIRCQRDKFLSAFQTAAMFAPARSPKEILQNVKLDADKDGVTLSATDMEVGVRVTVEGVEVDAAGSGVLPVSHVGSLLRENSDEFLTIETTARGTVIRGEHDPRVEEAGLNIRRFRRAAGVGRGCCWLPLSPGPVSARLRTLKKGTLWASKLPSRSILMGR